MYLAVTATAAAVPSPNKRQTLQIYKKDTEKRDKNKK